MPTSSFGIVFPTQSLIVSSCNLSVFVNIDYRSDTSLIITTKPLFVVSPCRSLSMPDLTESEAIKALFESTSDYLPFSHNPRSSTQDGNSPSSSLPRRSPLPLCKSLQHNSTCLASDPLRSTDPLLQHPSLNLSQASPITYFYPNGFFDNVAQSSSAPPSDVSPPFPTHSFASELWAQHVDPTLSSPAPCGSISCFDLVGTIGCGSYGKVLLGSISNESTGGSVLRAIKVMRKHDIHEDGVEEVKRELRALRWIADTARYVDATQQPQNCGVSFLQKMIESFQNEEFVFIVLVSRSWCIQNVIL